MEFDFQRYIEEHREPGERRTGRARNVSDYAFRGDVKQLHTLDGLAPVRLVMSGSLRLWRGWGRARLLKDALRVGGGEAPRVSELARQCVSALHMPAQVVYVAPALRDVAARAVGTDGDLCVVVQPEAVKALSDAALLFVLGRELGHVQNGHVSYATAAFYAEDLANQVVRWAFTPAVTAIRGWLRRSQLTADRAGLLCCRDLGVAREQMLRAALGERRMEEDIDVDRYLEELEAKKPGMLGSLSENFPDLRVRLAALQAFSECQFYLDHIGDRNQTGRSLSQVDDDVDEMLRGGVGSQSPRGDE